MATRGFNVRKQTGFTAIAVLCFAMLYLPIILLVAYSFNAGESIAVWEGFSWRWYVSAWQNETVQDATIRSVIIATCASLIATSAAVLAALATTRVKPWRGQTVAFALINQPLMVPPGPVSWLKARYPDKPAWPDGIVSSTLPIRP